MGAATVLAATGPAAGSGAAGARPMAVVPGGVVDEAARTAYLHGAGGGIDAVDVSSGRLRWADPEPQRPLAVARGRLLVELRGADGVRLRVREARAAGRTLATLEPLPLPAWALAASGRAFDSTAEPLPGGRVRYRWWAERRAATGEPEQAAGEIVVDVARARELPAKATATAAGAGATNGAARGSSTNGAARGSSTNVAARGSSTNGAARGSSTNGAARGSSTNGAGRGAGAGRGESMRSAWLVDGVACALATETRDGGSWLMLRRVRADGRPLPPLPVGPATATVARLSTDGRLLVLVPPGGARARSMRLPGGGHGPDLPTASLANAFAVVDGLLLVGSETPDAGRALRAIALVGGAMRWSHPLYTPAAPPAPLPPSP